MDKSLYHASSYPLRVSNGRDIGAGHTRGCWLEFSGLATTLT